MSDSDSGTTGSDTDTERAEYLRHRDYLIANKVDQHRQFDNRIAALSGGALALSLTFIKDIAPSPDPSTKWLALAAWTFFIVSLLATLFSHRTSSRDMQFEIEKLDRSYKIQAEDYDPRNPFKTATEWLNSLSVGTFLVGLILLVIFASVNF